MVLYFVARPAGTTTRCLITSGGTSEAAFNLSLEDFDETGEGEHHRVCSWNQRRISVDTQQCGSFLEVKPAFEGSASLFHCDNGIDGQGCLIQEGILQAEQQMEAYLKVRKLVELVRQPCGTSALV
ncbi:hypothetical protein EI42_06056 [Thermosporothrix hazakensis]|jgi:hypothetical protein|uniref:Uncharacterized protein n=1 Tax=Thermosporothrix hazakensis TaxID=644383 RepID=A0A326TU60_THEHA|nr:hypothetical protein EI42_06056 [Thermosporothrix hazakensis]